MIVTCLGSGFRVIKVQGPVESIQSRQSQTYIFFQICHATLITRHGHHFIQKAHHLCSEDGSHGLDARLHPQLLICLDEDSQRDHHPHNTNDVLFG